MAFVSSLEGESRELSRLHNYNENFREELIAHFPLLRHGPHRKRKKLGPHRRQCDLIGPLTKIRRGNTARRSPKPHNPKNIKGGHIDKHTVACTAVSGQRLGNQVPAAKDTNATIEERCFLRGSCRDVITRTVGAMSSVVRY
jgi:hypothetical protein